MGKVCSKRRRSKSIDSTYMYSNTFDDTEKFSSHSRKRKAHTSIPYRKASLYLDEIKTTTVKKYKQNRSKKKAWKPAECTDNYYNSSDYDSCTNSVRYESYDSVFVNAEQVDNGYIEPKYAHLAREHTSTVQKTKVTSRNTMLDGCMYVESEHRTGQTTDEHPYPDFMTCFMRTSEKYTNCEFQSTDSGFKSADSPCLHSSMLPNGIPDTLSAVNVDTANNSLADSDAMEQIGKEVKLMVDEVPAIHLSDDQKRGNTDRDSCFSDMELGNVHEELTPADSDMFSTMAISSLDDTTDTSLKILSDTPFTVMESMDLRLISASNGLDQGRMLKLTSLGNTKVTRIMKADSSTVVDDALHTHYPHTSASEIGSLSSTIDSVFSEKQLLPESFGTFPMSDYSDVYQSFHTDASKVHDLHRNITDITPDTSIVSSCSEANEMLDDLCTNKPFVNDDYATNAIKCETELNTAKVNEVNTAGIGEPSGQLNYMDKEKIVSQHMTFNSQRHLTTDKCIGVLPLAKGHHLNNIAIATNEEDVVESKSMSEKISSDVQAGHCVPDTLHVSHSMINGTFSNTITACPFDTDSIHSAVKVHVPDTSPVAYNTSDNNSEECDDGCMPDQNKDPIAEAESSIEIISQTVSTDTSVEKEAKVPEKSEVNVTILPYWHVFLSCNVKMLWMDMLTPNCLHLDLHNTVDTHSLTMYYATSHLVKHIFLPFSNLYPHAWFIGVIASDKSIDLNNTQQSMLECPADTQKDTTKDQHENVDETRAFQSENSSDISHTTVIYNSIKLPIRQSTENVVDHIGSMTDCDYLVPETLNVDSTMINAATADNSINVCNDQILTPGNTADVAVKNDGSDPSTSHALSITHMEDNNEITCNDSYSDLNETEVLSPDRSMVGTDDTSTDDGSMPHDSVMVANRTSRSSEQKKKPGMKSPSMINSCHTSKNKHPFAELNSNSVDSGVYSTWESLNQQFESLQNLKRQFSKRLQILNKRRNKKAYRQTHNRLKVLEKLTKGISRQWYHAGPTARQEYIVNPATGLDSYFERLRNGENVSIQEQMLYEWMRLNSFVNYSGNGNSLRLARSGFYVNPNSGDHETICFACGFRYSTWQYFDNIDEMHRRHSPNCPHVRGENATSQNVPIGEVSTAIPSTPTSATTTVADITSPATTTSTVVSGNTATSSGARVSKPATSLPADEEARSPSFDSFLSQPGPSLQSLVQISRADVQPTGERSVTSQPIEDADNRNYTTMLDSRTGRSLFPSLDTSSVVMLATVEHRDQTSLTRPTEPTAQPRRAQSAVASTSRTSDTQPRPAPSSQNETAGVNEPGAVHVDNPKHPDYVSLDVRMRSFTAWPSYLDQTPQKMAEAGFFYTGTADFARCFSCGGGLRNWEPGDNPLVEHTRWFWQCEYVTKLKGTAFTQSILRRQTAHLAQQEREAAERATVRAAAPDSDPLMSPAGVRLLAMEYEPERVKEAVLAVRQQKGRSKVTFDETLAWILDEEDKRRAEIRRAVNQVRAAATATATRTNQGSSSASATAVAAASSRVVNRATLRNVTTAVGSASQAADTAQGATGNGETESKKKHGKKKNKGKSGDKSSGATATSAAALLPRAETIDAQSLEAENQKLREMQVCKVCMDEPVSVTFLPCGHLVCCDDCAPSLKSCPICRKKIKGRVKTFMS